MPQRIADSSPPEEEVKSISPEVEPVQQEAQPVATKQDDDIASQTTVETAISEETKVSFLRVTVWLLGLDWKLGSASLLDQQEKQIEKNQKQQMRFLSDSHVA